MLLSYCYFSKGVWITSQELSGVEPINVFHRQLDKREIPESEHKNKHILFRAFFEIAHGSENTLIRISADDYYKLYINGRFVAQGPAPAYYFRYNFNEIDIGEYLVPGENLIAVHTYYQGLINRVWTSGDNRHGLIYEIESDGKIVAQSDDKVKCRLHSGYGTTGISGYKTQFMESYDAGAPEVGFQRPDFNDSAWENAALRLRCDYTLVPQKTPLLEFDEIKPSVITKKDFGLFIDFGKMYVGSLTLTARGKHGDTIDILCGQELLADGRVRSKLRANCVYEEKLLLSGKRSDRLLQYDYKSFRYLELIIPDGAEVDPESITLEARHYPFKLASSCRFDEPEFKAIWKLCVHSLKYGVQETIQDCMDREKGFYLGDGCYSALTHMVLTGDDRMVRKMFDDSLASSFVSDCLLTCADCSFMQEIAEYPLIMAELAAIYAKLRPSERAYSEQLYDKILPVIEAYSYRYLNSDGLLSMLDRWCVVEWPMEYRDGYDCDITEGRVCRDAHIVINAYYIMACEAMSRLALHLGKEPPFDLRALKENYIKHFYMENEHRFRDRVGSNHSSFPANVISYAFGLCPDAVCEEEILTYALGRGVTTANFFISFAFLFRLLYDGRDEELRSQLSRSDAWLRMISEGATSTFEGWGKDCKWNTSLFHLTFSYAALFLSRDFYERIK